MQKEMETADATPDAIFAVLTEALPMLALARSALMGDRVVFSLPFGSHSAVPAEADSEDFLHDFLGKFLQEFRDSILGCGAFAETDFEGPFVNFKGVPLGGRRAARLKTSLPRIHPTVSHPLHYSSSPMHAHCDFDDSFCSAYSFFFPAF